MQHSGEAEWIGGLAEMAGGVAFLDVVDGKRQSVLFVTEACNALDRKISQLDADQRGDLTIIREFAFHKSRIFSNSGLFRLADPLLDSQYIFAYEEGGDKNNGDPKFFEQYKKRNLTGLEFELVWSDEISR